MKALLPILKTKLFVLSFISACTLVLANNYIQRDDPFKFSGAKEGKVIAKPEKVSIMTKKAGAIKLNQRLRDNSFDPPSVAFTATVTSDLPDYAPLSLATFTGAGFAPNEDVVLKVKNLTQPCNTVSADSSYLPWTVTADADGAFVTTWTVCNCPGDSLRLRAVGQTSRDTAYAYFTDAGPTDPTAQSLPYIQNFGTLAHSSNDYPDGWQGWKLSSGSTTSFQLIAPNSDENLNASSSASTSGGGALNYNGKIGFLSTGSTDASLVLAISTTGSSSIVFQFDIMTIRNPYNGTSDTRINQVDIQYRVGTAGAFTSISGLTSGIYQNNTTAQTGSGVTTPQNSQSKSFTLPAACNNQAVVQLRWVQRDQTGQSGSRPSFAVDNISVFACTTPTLNATGTTLTLGCNPSASDINAALGTATSTDACATPTITSSDGNVQSNGCGRTQTRTFSLTDVAGNTASTSRTVTWTADVTPPTFTLTAGDYNDVTLGCNPESSDISAALGIASASDLCGAPTLTQSDGPVTSDGCIRIQVRTFTARDGCNNTATISRTVRWTHDVTPPSGVVGGSTLTLGCNPTASEINDALGTASATDACGPTTLAQSDGSVVSTGCNRSQTRTFTAVDACGNGITATRTVTWTEDLTPPVLIGDFTTVSLGCNPAASDIADALGNATATDNCGPTTVAATDGGVLSNNCYREQTRSFIARDGCGNTSTASRTVTWTVDLTPPVFTSGFSPVVLGCNPAASDITGALDGATASDACGPVTITTSDGSVQSDGCSRSQTRTFTARDACGNTSTASRTVTWVADVTPPTIITGELTFDLGCNPSPNDVETALGTVTATDACGPTTITIVDSGPGSVGCDRIARRIFGAKDGCGNGSTAIRVVTWKADLTPPTLTTGGTSQSLACNPAASDINNALGTASASDACGPTTIAQTDGAVQSDNCTRSQTRTWLARDGCGNTATAARTVTWIIDVTPPGISASGTTLNLGCNPTLNDVNDALGNATATDGCGPTTVTSVDGSVVSSACGRTQTRTFTAKDGCGNTSTISRIVNWEEDHAAPAIEFGQPKNTAGLVAGDIAFVAFQSDNPDQFAFVSLVNIITSTQINFTDNGWETDNTFRIGEGVTRWTAPAGGISAGTVVIITPGTTPTANFGTMTNVSGTFSLANSDDQIIAFTGTFNTTTGAITGGSVITGIQFNNATWDANAADAATSALPLGLTNGTDAVAVGAVDNGKYSCAATTTAIAATLRTSLNTAGNWTTGASPFSPMYPACILTVSPTMPEPITVSCASDIPEAPFVNSRDDCGPHTFIPAVETIINQTCANRYTLVRTWTAYDDCGNTATASQTITVNDITPPAVSANGSTLTLGCNPSASDINAALGSASSTDQCGSSSVMSSDGSVQSDGCSRSQTRTFNATDACGNTTTTSRTVTWTADVTPPTFTGTYTPVNLGCNPTVPEVLNALAAASATDVCGPVTITQSDGSVVSDGCDRSQTRMFTARDACGNTSTVARTVTWIADLAPPVFTGSYTTVPLGCNPSANDIGIALDGATATDACGPVTITQNDGPVQSTGCTRSQTRIFTAEDGCGNTATIARTVTWTADVVPPTFTGTYSDVPLGCNPKATDITAALDGATATDACGPVTLTQSNSSVVSNGCIRSQTRTFTARDACGNTSTVSRTVTWTEDTTQPDFTGSYTTVSLGCNPAASDITGALDGATATDACSAPTISFKDGTVTSSGCNRTQIRTFTAKDACGNQRTISRTVTWIADVTPPVFTGTYSNVDLGCNPFSTSITAALGSATATDACSVKTITQSDGAVTTSGCVRTQTRTFTAQDNCGNTATTSRTVTWIVDVTPPTFTGSYTPVDLDCNPAASDITAALDGATASDACSTPTITRTDGAVQSDGCVRSQTRRFFAQDFCGNTSQMTRTVTWIVDVTPPTFTGNYNTVPLGCNPKGNDVPNALDGATATDACSTPTITFGDGPVQSTGCNRSQTRIFTAKDHCGNTSTTSRTVTWTEDVTPPTFTGSYSDVELGCNPASSNITAALDGATATDECGPASIISFKDDAVVSTGCRRSQTRTFFARDGCQNQSTISRTVKWTSDLTPPTGVVGGANLNLGCNPTASDINEALGTAAASDACGPVTLTQSDGAVTSTGCSRSQTRTFTARDACGNGITATRTAVWISDVTPPTINCPSSVTTQTTNAACSYVVPGTAYDATATDGCGGTPARSWRVTNPNAATQTGNSTLAGTSLYYGLNTITWTATDGCNNTSSCSFTVNVNKIATTATVSVSPTSQQYSDKVTFTATVTPFNCTGAGAIGGEVKFKIGTMVIGTAPIASDGTAVLTAALLEDQLYDADLDDPLNATSGPLDPQINPKTVTACFENTGAAYLVTNPTTSLTVTCEDADITYNGQTYFTVNPNTLAGTVNLSAYGLDINDVPPHARGDIRNAVAKFREGGPSGTVKGEADSIPFGLINPGNYQEGIATTFFNDVLTNAEASGGGKVYNIWVGGGNYYCGGMTAGDKIPITLAMPGQDFVTGGGYTVFTSTNPSAGSYAGTVGKRMNFGFVMKWNPSGSNLQGQVNVIYRRVVNGVTRIYQIKSNAINSLVVQNVNDAGQAVVAPNITFRKATITTKANLKDITDPLNEISLGGNLSLTVVAWESTTNNTGALDRITVQLNGSGSLGLLFANSWAGAASTWQTLTGGKIQVRNATTPAPARVITTAVEKENPGIIVPFNVNAYPNPSEHQFTLSVEGATNEKVHIVVYDALGRQVKIFEKDSGNVPIHFGADLKVGMYVVEVRQGKNRKSLKLVKH